MKSFLYFQYELFKIANKEKQTEIDMILIQIQNHFRKSLQLIRIITNNRQGSLIHLT